MTGYPTLADYWSDIYDRRSLVAMTVATAMAVALVVSVALPPVYEAKTVFYAPINISLPSYTNSVSGATLGQAPFMPPSEEKLASSGIGILRSKDMFRRLAADFPGLGEDALRKNTDIKVSREFMLEVYVRHRNPRTAAEIANRYPGLYRGFNVAQLRTHMEAIRDAALRELTAVELRLAELRGREGVSGSATPSGGAAYLAGSTDERLRATVEKLRNVAAEAALQAQQPTAPLVVVETAMPPVRPIFPLLVLNVIVSAITGLALGCYYALICGMVARSRMRRIERQLDLPSLTPGELTELRVAAEVGS